MPDNWACVLSDTHNIPLEIQEQLNFCEETGYWPDSVFTVAEKSSKVSDKTDKPNKVKGCPFCPDSKHDMNKCPLDPKERYNKAKMLRLCNICLKSGHFWMNCPYKAKCERCKQHYHHKAMCFKDLTKSAEVQSTPSSPASSTLKSNFRKSSGRPNKSVSFKKPHKKETDVKMTVAPDQSAMDTSTTSDESNVMLVTEAESDAGMEITEASASESETDSDD
jgi:hypothetical protein